MDATTVENPSSQCLPQSNVQVHTLGEVWRIGMQPNVITTRGTGINVLMAW
jgi:hypothetical protein